MGIDQRRHAAPAIERPRFRILGAERTRRRADEPVVLVPVVKQAVYQVTLERFARVVAEREDARIVAFWLDVAKAEWRGLSGLAARSKRRRSISDDVSLHYRRFAHEVRALRPTIAARWEARREVNRYFRAGPSKASLEQFAVRGQRLGDLVYDQMVKEGTVLVNPGGRGTRRHLYIAALHAILIDNLFAQLDVTWVVVPSTALSSGLADRAAYRHGVPRIVGAQDHAYRPRKDQEFLDVSTGLRRRFMEIADADREELLVQAREFLHSRRQRLLGIGDENQSESGDISVPSGPGGRPVVLVAVHSFFDDPHAVGIGLFADFLDWIEHLTSLISQTDYIWKFKLHPGEREDRIGARAAVENLLASYPNAHILSDEITHPQLLSEGVALVLTIYGTIGFEYPAIGIPVVTAAASNPHHRYRYCLHAESVDQYDEIVLDPNRWGYGIPMSDIEEYVAMRYLMHGETPFQNVSAIARLHGENSGDALKDPGFLDVWQEHVSQDELDVVDRALRDWIDSGEYSLGGFLADRALQNRGRPQSDALAGSGS